VQSNTERKLKYLGVVTSISKKNNQVIISDFPKEIKQLPNNIDIAIGYSPNFIIQFKADSFIFEKKCIKIKLAEPQQESKLQSFIRQAVYIDENIIKVGNPDIILPEDLLDLEVINIENNQVIGTIADINETDANQILIIENDDYFLPIPNVKEIVKIIKLDERKIYIQLIDGLLDLKEEKKRK
jgi:ribosomal 30S subunit maturation factor RimM